MSLNEDFEREREEAYANGYHDGLRAGKLAFHTEWGVDAPGLEGVYAVGRGKTTTERHAVARGVTSNMREAGHEAHVVWRGVTDWHKEES